MVIENTHDQQISLLLKSWYILELTILADHLSYKVDVPFLGSCNHILEGFLIDSEIFGQFAPRVLHILKLIVVGVKVEQIFNAWDVVFIKKYLPFIAA
jgi:hypothetical protein